MGFSNNAKKPFVGLFEGAFEVKCDKGTDPAIKHRVAENPTTGEKKDVYARYYNEYDGNILSITAKEGKYGKQILVEMDDIIIQVPYSGRHSTALLNALPNIRHDKPVTFKPWRFKPADKEKFMSGWTIEQCGGKVEGARDLKEDPEIPRLEELMVKGKKTWDDSKQLAWLEQNHLDPWSEAHSSAQPAVGDGAPADLWGGDEDRHEEAKSESPF
jgi:hypothetical protein